MAKGKKKRDTVGGFKIIEYTSKSRSDLHAAPYNPREIEDSAREALKESIQRFGLVQSLVWNKRSGNVVGGNQRLEILDELGIKENIPVSVVDLDDNEERLLNIVLNAETVQGYYTEDAEDILKELMEQMPGDVESLNLTDLLDLSDDEDEDEDDDDEDSSGDDSSDGDDEDESGDEDFEGMIRNPVFGNVSEQTGNTYVRPKYDEDRRFIEISVPHEEVDQVRAALKEVLDTFPNVTWRLK